MIRKMTCIECPMSCALVVDGEDCRVVSVSGNKCPKGEAYAKAEIGNPTRILTATVLAQGLSLKMVPVRSRGPIPRARIAEAAAAARKLRIERPVRVGDVVVPDFLGLGVDLIATRDVE